MKNALGYMVTIVRDGIISKTAYENQELALNEVKIAIGSPAVIEVSIHIVAEIKNGS